MDKKPFQTKNGVENIAKSIRLKNVLNQFYINLDQFYVIVNFCAMSQK